MSEKMVPMFQMDLGWDGVCVIAGTGPSLTRAQCEMAEQGADYTIAVNSAYKLFSATSMIYAADDTWWTNHPEARQVDCLKVTARNTPTTEEYKAQVRAHVDPTIYPVRCEPQNEGMKSSREEGLVSGGNSGYQAIQIAAWCGAKVIALIGYDLTTKGANIHSPECVDGGKNYPHQPGLSPERFSERYLPRFASLVEPLERMGVKVINCTPDSALTCWPYRPLEQVVRLHAAA